MAYADLVAPNVLGKFTMYFSGDDEGWSEGHYMVTNPPTQANLDAIVNARLAILPATLTLDWAKYSKLGGPRDRIAYQKSFPLIGQWQDYAPNNNYLYYGPNRIVDAVVYAEETDIGEFCTKYLHGVPDNCTNEDVLLASVVVPPQPLPYPPVGSPTWYALVGSYLATLKTTTVMGRNFLKAGATQVTQQQSAISAIYVRRLRGHKVGLPFGHARGRAIPR